jgi:hypothetical protein
MFLKRLTKTNLAVGLCWPFLKRKAKVSNDQLISRSTEPTPMTVDEPIEADRR